MDEREQAEQRMLDGGEEWNSFRGLDPRRVWRKPHPLVTFLLTIVLGTLLIAAIVGAPRGLVGVNGLATRVLALVAFAVILALNWVLRYLLPQVTSRRRTVVWPLPKSRQNSFSAARAWRTLPQSSATVLW